MALLFTNNPEDDFNSLLREITNCYDEIKRLQVLNEGLTEKVSTLEGYFSEAVIAETTKYVASSSGGAVTDEIKFKNGILTQT